MLRALAIVVAVTSVAAADPIIEHWEMTAKPIAGPRTIDVARFDIAHYRLRTFGGGDRRTAPTWASEQKLEGVTNAGMFHESGAPVGLIVSDGHDRGSDNPKMSGYLAWDPVSASDAPVVVAGRDCKDFDLAALRRRYRSIMQSYRLLGCDGKAMPWGDPKHYSAAAIGVDRNGRVVMILARGAVLMAELSKELAGHDLAGALFLEGGPEASLVVRDKLSVLGSYETGFVENDDNHEFWKLPNVIGVLARRP